MRRVFATVVEAPLPLLLILILVGTGTLPKGEAFPAAATTPLTIDETATVITVPPGNNETGIAGTEYPVFVGEEAASDADSVTETFMVIEEQEEEEDDSENGGDSSTMSPALFQTTLPMRSPKSSREQEDVLRELKKLWDLSQTGSRAERDPELKQSLSSIVYLAYARIYSESDETLLKLKYLLRKLQERLVGKEEESDGPSSSTTASPKSLRRRRRSYYDAATDEDIESIFFANVNSEENSLIPGSANSQENLRRSAAEIREKYGIVIDSGGATASPLLANKTDPLDRSGLGVGTILSSSTTTVSTVKLAASVATPQKVVHINDRRKVMPSFYLSPERIQELKNKMKTTTTTKAPATVTTSPPPTLSPISIPIQDELENEVNTLQQQGQVDNYDVHISHDGPVSPTQSPFTAEQIALALFQLLRPDVEDQNRIEVEQEKVTVAPHPSPSTILYQVGSLSSVLNFTVGGVNQTTTTTTTSTTTSAPTTSTVKATTSKTTTTTAGFKLQPSVLSILKLKGAHRRNETLLDLPSELSNLGSALAPQTTSRTTTERHLFPGSNDQYDDDYSDEVDPMPPMRPPTLLDGIRDAVQASLMAVSRLSVGAKLVLLFSVSISVISIGFGLYAVGPPLAGVGVLRVVIPIILLFFIELGTVPAGKRRLEGSGKEQLLEKVEGEEFGRILDQIFDAVLKYGKGDHGQDANRL